MPIPTLYFGEYGQVFHKTRPIQLHMYFGEFGQVSHQTQLCVHTLDYYHLMNYVEMPLLWTLLIFGDMGGWVARWDFFHMMSHANAKFGFQVVA